MTRNRRIFLSAAGASLALASLAIAGSNASAQEWPTKPIRIIVPYPAGGNADSASRSLAEAVTGSLKQPLIVDNRPGASTIIGTEMVARSTADGYTIGLVTDSHAINHALGSQPKGIEVLGAKVSYDAIRDFIPICGVALVPLVLVVHPSVAARSVKELVQLSGSRKGKGLNFGSMGAGSPWYWHMHQLRKLTGAKLVDVSYKGLAPAATDLLGGQIDTMLMPVHFAQQHIKAGKLLPLATLGAKRHPILPEVPTLAEAGYPGLEITNWFMFVAPSGTPQSVIDRLSREFVAVLKTPALRDKFALTGDPYPADASEVAARLARDIESYGSVIRANIN
jgi:tripartite-type tricarboxylate transporter receptor subunit TctC